MKKCVRVALCATVMLSVPTLSFAQGVADKLESLHSVLDNMYEEMMPMCQQLTGVGRGIAGFGALWYIASRVWRSLANAEPIDFYPLFRPFVLGFCILWFPLTLKTLKLILQPIVEGTSAMVKNTDQAVAVLLKQKEEAIKTTDPWKMYVGQDGKGDRDKWYRYTYDEDPSEEGAISSIGNSVMFSIAKATYSFKSSIKEMMSEVLKVLFQAASLCVNTIRTFQLIILSILGPIVFGLAVFDGFAHTLTAWMAKYINIFLWLPVANVFGALIGKIQEEMLKLDLSQIHNTGDTFFSSADTGYLIFMIIAIVGYCMVPSVANSIVHAGHSDAMTQRITSIVAGAPGLAAATAGRAASGATNIANMGRNFNEGLSGQGGGMGSPGAGNSGAETVGRMLGKAYMSSKLSGDKS